MRDASDSRHPPLPVPGDAHLPDGVLPFTAFGQFGPAYIDSRCMEQDVYWADVSGAPHFLADLSPEDVDTAIVFLEDCAPAWHLQKPDRLSLEILHRATTDPGEDTAAPLRAEALALIADDPLDWMNRPPLMRRLCELQAAQRRRGER